MSGISSSSDEMTVVKRDGSREEVSFDKILERVKNVGKEANIQIKYSALVMKIIDQLYDGIQTTQLDELTAEQCASQSTVHTDYGTLAGRIIVSNNHKNTLPGFYDKMMLLYGFIDVHGNNSPFLNEPFMDVLRGNRAEIEAMIDYDRDYLIDYFGYKTLERAYLFKLNKVIVERPQDMWMRVAITVHGSDMAKLKTTYDLLSQKYFTHATPTLFNSGTRCQQLSSCYLIAMEDDSIDGIYNTLKDCANISKYAGGIGLHIHNVRASGTLIRGTNGTSNGIVPMLRVFNNTARYVDQGGGKRNGSFAIYLEPWHADIHSFLDMRKNQGDEELKARDLFYALWIPDLFMKRVHSNGTWSLMCPHKCPGLSDVYGDAFEELYEKYEAEGNVVKTVQARDLWFSVLDSQMETGTPYLLYKDACNKKSNQKNLGVIKSSNLCTEIVEYSDDKETAVCNLASISLSNFVDEKTRVFDYDKLSEVTSVVTENLNKIIDVNFYPTAKTQVSNGKHRPIGIGVQGLADAFFKMDLVFGGNDARETNKKIFETIYYAACSTSCQLAIDRYENMLADDDKSLTVDRGELSGAYISFEGSPMSNGQFQFDMWNATPDTDRYDWDALRARIMRYGMVNSLLLAPMPTASTAQILGNNECFEPITSNIYSRRTIAGEFIVVNKYLMRELIDAGVWSDEVKNNIISNKGSVQNLDGISQHLKDKYRIVWEMKMKDVIDMAADRGKYVCQSQSMNLWQEDPNYGSLTSMHFYAWNKGLKTGMYYLRRKAKHQAQQFTVDPTKGAVTHGTPDPVTGQDQDEGCEMCSA